eukprot:6636282-Prymnesium_polylepis.2
MARCMVGGGWLFGRVGWRLWRGHGGHLHKWVEAGGGGEGHVAEVLRLVRDQKGKAAVAPAILRQEGASHMRGSDRRSCRPQKVVKGCDEQRVACGRAACGVCGVGYASAGERARPSLLTHPP